MKAETLPSEVHAVLEKECGEGARLDPISDRRGCAVWRVTGPARTAALKVGIGPEGTVITAREGAVLAAMGARDGLLHAGRAESLAWMLTPWHEGPSTWQALQGVRAGTGDLQTARRHVVEVCETVARLHAAGWVHCDLQPGHAIHTARGVSLIDCSWAWHPERLAPSAMFRGGMPHLLAPELAAAVERGELPVAPRPSAEVYTLAASLWWGITGDWPLDYGAAGVDPAWLKAGPLRQVIGSGRVPLRAPTAWASVQEVLHAALAPSPARRPTAAELADALRHA
ncbi:hypothetical protein [Streptomyces sp. KR55]|uniref:hypothetical protein n=1 Tax=Streptomyces sp. KR55 TaxID=3457425 RepID=UPI003FCF4004